MCPGRRSRDGVACGEWMAASVQEWDPLVLTSIQRTDHGSFDATSPSREPNLQQNTGQESLFEGHLQGPLPSLAPAPTDQ